MSEKHWDEQVDKYIWLRENNNGDFSKIEEALCIERVLCIFGQDMIERAIKRSGI